MTFFDKPALEPSPLLTLKCAAAGNLGCYPLLFFCFLIGGAPAPPFFLAGHNESYDRVVAWPLLAIRSSFEPWSVIFFLAFFFLLL